jgi:polysaccharide pyruvyl transferase WcaK-like protein
MRIVVEPGSYTCMNMGDVAMMQVCVARLAEIWPNSQIQIVTESPERLTLFCPNAVPIIAAGKDHWFEDNLFGRLQGFLPPGLRPALQRSERALRHRFPSGVGSLLVMKRRVKSLDSRGILPFIKAILHADLVIACGTGMINDEFRSRALQMLATLGMANQHGIPTAMVCQGIGPLTDLGLLASLKAILPKVRLISLRERLLGPEILKRLNYPPDRIALAADDGLQLAFDHRSAVLGGSIGMNLRLAKYSQIDANIADAIRPALKTIADRLAISFTSVPILFRENSDVKAIAALIAGFEDQWSGAPVMTPFDVIQRIGRCRLVVTGSYHGAVFALGQGIPAVTVAKSPYYLGKFKGLQEQFGDGCQLIDWSNHVRIEELISTVHRTWNSAAELKPTLLRVAEEQIRSSNNAYLKLHRSVSCATDGVA